MYRKVRGISQNNIEKLPLGRRIEVTEIQAVIVCTLIVWYLHKCLLCKNVMSCMLRNYVFFCTSVEVHLEVYLQK